MNRTRWRAAGSIAGGVFVALALFLFMNTLISGGRGQQGAASAGQIVDLIRVQEDEVVQTKRRVRPKKPPPPKDPPPPPKLRISNEAKPLRNPMRLDLPQIDVSGAAGGGPFIGRWEPGDPAAEGEAIPIVRIDPQWPREALIDGTDGYVRFRVLIGADGSVKDTEVVDAAPGRLFVRNATRAVRRWRFKPRVVDGTPVERWATTTLVFQLGD
ncbi:MAG: energy transducer TonB [Gammaproteobacteria bacterium]|nr:energy transducer TonB [Gammaproteobacteria bacterium]MCY4165160.1 energy transducer TonB [Gammaproteobacteria bacterium]MCY4256397.1 energy transducer TonB [Gammaproteobacteria bacterium]MCY4339836.1 energy transducer TonB [Gammaproteobacteria bacterium]